MSLASWGLIESINYEEINNNHLVNDGQCPGTGRHSDGLESQAC